MKRKPIAAANWKLNKTSKESTDWCKELLRQKPAVKNCEVVVAPVALSIDSVSSVVNNTYISLAAQNVYSKDTGAFTGELSAKMIKEFACQYSIVGHSERRTIFHETDQEISQKNKALISAGLLPIFCIGETLQEREAGKVKEVLKRQITMGLESVALDGKNLVIAYEPVWAIGTGKVASENDAQEAHNFIRSVVQELYGKEISQETPILYGGSVKAENIEGLINQEDIDGGLVGGASLEVSTFLPIINAIENYANQ